MSDAAVKLEDVTRIFDKGIGVMHIDLEIPTGTCLALIGPNGAGKSTTLRLVVGVLKADGGGIRSSTSVETIRAHPELSSKPSPNA